MPELPQEVVISPTVAAIYAHYEATAEKRFSRRIGASVIGDKCGRRIWYGFRWAGRENFSGRMLRLFETGHLEEVRFAKNLKSIGTTVFPIDPATGEQFELTALAGHFVAKLDGVATGLPESKSWHTLSFKTANHKSFTSIRNGGLQHAKPEHYAQVMAEMHLTGLKCAADRIERALYLIVNKNDDELYAERIRYDKDEAESLLAKALSVIQSENPPPRVSDHPDKFPCSFCCHKQRCHGTESGKIPIAVNCRTCAHSTPLIQPDREDGPWICEKHNREITTDEQLAGCPDHLFIPSLVEDAAGATQSHATADSVTYIVEGEPFTNSKRQGERSIDLSTNT